MFAYPALPSDEAWNQLQEPARPSQSPQTQLLRLLAALDTGWQVEEPVYLRSRWSEGDQCIYCFILHRSTQDPPLLLTLPATSTVEQFLRSEGLRVLS